MKTLKKVLMINGLSSGSTGLLLAVMPNPIANLFAAGPNWPFTATGLFLLLFAALVLYAGMKKEVDGGLVKTIIFLDITWVIGSIVIVALGLFNLSTIGYLLITAVAIWVGLMAYLQYSGLKKLQAVSL